MNDPVVIEYLKQLQDRFVIVPIDKAANNFSFICKKYYVSKLLEEVGIPFGDKPTYKLQNVEKESIIQTNTLFCEKYKLAVSKDQKTLPIMYWIPKMHKILFVLDLLLHLVSVAQNLFPKQSQKHLS